MSKRKKKTKTGIKRGSPEAQKLLDSAFKSMRRHRSEMKRETKARETLAKLNSEERA